jgi:hypothetical protein
MYSFENDDLRDASCDNLAKNEQNQQDLNDDHLHNGRITSSRIIVSTRVSSSLTRTVTIVFECYHELVHVPAVAKVCRKTTMVIFVSHLKCVCSRESDAIMRVLPWRCCAHRNTIKPETADFT